MLSTLALILGAFSFLLGETLLKLLTQTYSPYEIMFVRSLLLVVLITTYSYIRREPEKLKTQNFKMHLLRSCFSISSFFFTLKALSVLKLYSFKSLYFLSPIFTASMGLIVLKEQYTRWNILAIFMCLLGAWIAFKPGSEVMNIYGVYAVLAALSTSLAILTFKKMASTETTNAIIFYYSLLSIAVSIYFVDFTKYTINPSDTIIFTGVAILHIIGSFLYTYGLRCQKLTLVSTVNYFSLPVAMLLGWSFWQEFPSNEILAASVLILASNLLLFIHNFNQSKLKISKP